MILLFVLYPLIEIALFVLIGGKIGLWATLGLVMLAGMAGLLLIQGQGLRARADMMAALRSAQDPSRPMAHGALRMLAGVLLIVPGFFSDLLGLALLVPGVRDAVLAHLARRVTGMSRAAPRDPFQDAWQAEDPRYSAHRRPRAGAEDIVIDADYTHVEPPAASLPPGRRPPSGWSRG